METFIKIGDYFFHEFKKIDDYSSILTNNLFNPNRRTNRLKHIKQSARTFVENGILLGIIGNRQKKLSDLYEKSHEDGCYENLCDCKTDKHLGIGPFPVDSEVIVKRKTD